MAVVSTDLYTVSPVSMDRVASAFALPDRYSRYVDRGSSGSLRGKQVFGDTERILHFTYHSKSAISPCTKIKTGRSVIRVVFSQLKSARVSPQARKNGWCITCYFTFKFTGAPVGTYSHIWLMSYLAGANAAAGRGTFWLVLQCRAEMGTIFLQHVSEK